MVWVIVVLYVLAAVLPAIGFVRLLRRAGRDLETVMSKVRERGGSTSLLISDFNEQNSDITRAPRQLRTDLWWDTALVGSGLAFGAAASIWSLFLA